MPFQSEKQRRYMHANLPDIAKRWERDYAGGGITNLEGRIGFDSGTNYKTRKELIEEADLEISPSLLDYLSEKSTVGSDKYNIKFSPEAELSLSKFSEGDVDVNLKNIMYGGTTTANLGPVEIGMDITNYLDKYDVTEDDVTVAKDTQKDEQIAFSLGLNLKDLYARIDSDKEFKKFYLTIRKTFGGPKNLNQGGVVPAHEAGIYGLAEGGSIAGGHQIGTPIGNRTGFGSPHDDSPTGPGSSSSGVGGGTSFSGGDGAAGNVNINPHFDPPAVLEEQKKTDELNRKISQRNEWRDRNDNNKKKDWVNKNLDTLDAGLKLKKFATSLNPLDLLKVNPAILGGSFLYNKFRNKNKDTTLGYDNSIDFGQGLGDDAKVLGDTDFSEIEDLRVDISANDIKLINYGKKHGLTTPTEIRETVGPGFNQEKPPTDAEIKGVLEGTITKPTGIFAAQGGIAGLKDGGRTGFFTGMREAEQQAQHGDVAHGPGGRFDVANQPTQTTTTRDTSTGDGDAREQYIATAPIAKPRYKESITHHPSIDGPITTNIRDYYDPRNTYQKRAPQTAQEKSLLDQIAFWTGAIVTGGGLLGIKVPGAVQSVNTALSYRKNINWGIKKLQELDVIDKSFTVDEVFQGLVDNAKKRKAKTDEYKLLPPGHPDRVALEIELEIGKKPEHLGDDGGTQETGITYDDMEGYNEKVQASTEWRQEQEKVENAKRDAYLAAFRQKYLMGDTEEPQTMFVAQGGRVPAGYNTGGLSNLFKLKNV